MINDNSEALVFMIKGFQGYWVIKHGKVYKLLSGILGMREVDGSRYICQNYGSEYINDIIKEEFRVGRAYAKCLFCNRIKKRSAFIKLE